MTESEVASGTKDQIIVEDVDEALIKCGGFHKF